MAVEKDYSATPLAKKLGIATGARVVLDSAPDGFERLLAPLPDGVRLSPRASGAVDVAILFVTEAKRMRSRFTVLADALTNDGRLWVAYPKRSSTLATDLDFEQVQTHGLDEGLVDNKSCAIDADWSGLQFVYRRSDRLLRNPQPGKG